MYKIIMAENQQQSIDMVERVIEYAKRKVELIHTVNSGTELVPLVKEQKPEIVLIGVDLLGINGLEAAKRIRSFDKEVHIILFSDYDYFDFAKEAISCKVDDYILKPLYYENLCGILDRVIAIIDEEKVKQRSAMNCLVQLGEVSEYLDYSFIYSILFNGQNEAELKRYKELLGFKECGYIINIEMSLNKNDTSLVMSDVYKNIKEIVSREHMCAVGPRVLNRIIVFISEKECNQDEGAENRNIQELAYEISERIRNILNIEISIGIGSVRGLDEIHISYEEALRSLRYRGKSAIVHVRDIKKTNIEHKSYLELESKMMENIKFGKEETVAYFSRIMELLRPLKNEAKVNKVIELLVLLSHEARIEAQGENEYIDYVHYVEEIQNLPWEKVETWAYQKLEYIIKIIRVNRSGKKSNSIKEAIQYMEEHYQEEISLEDLSQYIGISPQHLSKLFKEETGINYVELLTNLRIDMAKQLLSEGVQTVKEICYLVGYHDPNYFSRIFKKMVGISPTDYANGDKTSNSNS